MLDRSFTKLSDFIKIKVTQVCQRLRKSRRPPSADGGVGSSHAWSDIPDAIMPNLEARKEVGCNWTGETRWNREIFRPGIAQIWRVLGHFYL